jgi:hypothetical protein
MPNPPTPQLARIDRQDLSAMLPHWNYQERGRYLRGLFRARGIDPDRLYTITYYPHRHCWLLTQPSAKPAPTPTGFPGLPPRKADELFYSQVTTELRRTALAAVAAVGLHSAHFTTLGAKYQLPAPPQELSPSALRKLLGDPTPGGGSVRFDTEGGWQAGPSRN